MKKKISFMDSKSDIWNTSFNLKLMKDSDRDGKYDWIDCKPYDKTKQERIRLICNECGHTFTRSIGRNTYEVRCPKCGGYDTEPA